MISRKRLQELIDSEDRIYIKRKGYIETIDLDDSYSVDYDFDTQPENTMSLMLLNDFFVAKLQDCYEEQEENICKGDEQ